MHAQRVGALKHWLVSRMFVETADEDYLAARTLFQLGIFHGFLWSANHCIEKYLKALLLFNGRSAKKSHNTEKLYSEALRLDSRISFPDLSYDSRWGLNERFPEPLFDCLRKINKYGSPSNRYCTYGYDVRRDDLNKLDHVVFHLRAFCRIRYINIECDIKLDMYEFAHTQFGWQINPLSILEKVLNPNADLGNRLVEFAKIDNVAFLGAAAPLADFRPSASKVGAFVDWMFPLDPESSSQEDVEATQSALSWALDSVKLAREDENAIRAALCRSRSVVPIRRAVENT